ncbi:MAG TPA: YraN family protein [Acidimicrobiia bacterium]|nr:YraN family protein [Acidimicrobiia bacterium]
MQTDRRESKPGPRDQGRQAEAIAADYLTRQGATILARNVKVGRGEVDLVASIGGERTVVEVRSTTASSGNSHPVPPTHPLDAFDHAKAVQVRRLAGALGCPRVDLIAIRFHPGGVDLHWVKRAA